MHAYMLSLGCCLALMMSPAAAGSLTGGSADGALTINGETVALRHAYASTQQGFFEASSQDIRVLLTDRPVEAPALQDDFVLNGLARAGQVRGVAVIVSAKHEPISGTILDQAFKGSMSEWKVSP